MLTLVWDDEALSQFESILDYIAAQNVAAADRLELLIHERIETLRTFPAVGRPGRVEGTRELVPHPNFIVIYQSDSMTVDIIRILHTRRRYP